MKPRPRYGWNEATALAHRRVISVHEPTDEDRAIAAENLAQQDALENRTVPESRSEYTTKWRKEYPIADPGYVRVPNDLVAQLRGGPVTSPWIERAHEALAANPKARRAMPVEMKSHEGYSPGGTVYVA